MNFHALKQSFHASSPLVKWGSLLIVLILIWSILIQPLFSWKSEQNLALQQKIKKTVKILALKENAALWSQAKKALMAASEQAKDSYYHTATATQAQAQFQLLLQQLVDKNKLQLKNQRVTATLTQPGIGDKLPLWLHLESKELANIIKFLDELANQKKIIIVEKFNIADLGRTKLLQMSVAAFRYDQQAISAQAEDEAN